MQLRLLNSENGLIFGIDQAGRMPLMSIEPPQDYAPDLNWLLQSNQTPPEVILEVLVQEFYPQIYYLAFTLLDDRSAALNTANEIFARAILERHAYRTHTEASIWLLRLALKTCETSYKRLSLQRAVKSALPHHHSSKDLGYSTPETLLDAEIWLARCEAAAVERFAESRSFWDAVTRADALLVRSLQRGGLKQDREAIGRASCRERV